MRRSTTTSAWWISASLIAGLLASCGSPPAYRSLSDGTQWELIAFGEGSPMDDSVAWIRLDAKLVDRHTGTTLARFDQKPFTGGSDPVWQFLSGRQVGDSVHLRFGTPNFLFPQLAPGDTVLAAVAIRGFRSAGHMRSAQQREFRTLDSLSRSDSVARYYEEFEGMWYRPLRFVADTLRVRAGKEVVIHYEGRHLDGRVFDDSRLLEGPFRFVYGNEGQVITGIETALGRMRRGEVVEVVLPSWLAFGKRGSSDGRVGPYTPVVYRIEVVDVARR